MSEKKKYYWLRLKRDFFKRHDITIIESMENGKDYILFYLKLLCESVDHEGNLRFSDEIPYNDKMLATITNTNVDIVRTAIEVFTNLGMMDIMDDGTYYMNGVEKMIGEAEQDEHTRESARLRAKAYRERKKQALLSQNVSVTLPSRYDNVIHHGEIEKEKEIEIEKEIDKKKDKKEKPVKHTYGEYGHVRLTDKERDTLMNEFGEMETSEAIKYLDEYIEMKGYKAQSHYLCIRKWVFDAVKRDKNKPKTQERDIVNEWRNA